MKKLLFSSLAMAVVSTGFCYTKGDLSVDSNQKTWSKDGISVTARLEQKEYSIQEPINLEIIITNNSNADIFVILSNPLKQFKFTMLNKEQNKSVSLMPFGKQLENQEFFRRIVKKIESKKNYTEKIDMKSLFDMSLSGEYSISFEGSYLNNSKEKFINFKIEDINFSIKKEDERQKK